MLIDICPAKAIWHRTTSSNRGSGDIEKHIVGEDLATEHPSVDLFRDKCDVRQQQALECHVLAADECDTFSCVNVCPPRGVTPLPICLQRADSVLVSHSLGIRPSGES